jgi:hypothetical protein
VELSNGSFDTGDLETTALLLRGRWLVRRLASHFVAPACMDCSLAFLSEKSCRTARRLVISRKELPYRKDGNI